MKYAILAILLALAACTDPALNANVSIGPGGVSVSPSVSGSVGGVGVSISG